MRGLFAAVVSGLIIFGGLPGGVRRAEADGTPAPTGTTGTPAATGTASSSTAPASGTAAPTASATAAASATPAALPTPAASGTAAATGTPAASGTPVATGTPASSSTPDASGTPVSAASPVADAFREREDQLAVQLSRVRVAAGLQPLARSLALDRAAQDHARDMAVQGYMDHDAPDGSTPGSRAASDGYETPAGSGWLVVEVISARGDDPESPLDWWLGDGVHRRVVLGSRWREVGIGYAPGGPYGRFWVADVGCRPGILPPVLLDGELTIPDEGCDQSGSAFGPLQSVRVAETSTAARSQEWAPYTGLQQAWAAGKQAVVELRDAAGRELEMHATDPSGAAAETP